MNKKRTLLIATVTAATMLATSAAVFADQTKAGPGNALGKIVERYFGSGDPAQRLEKEKAAIRQKVSDGKMTQEEADKLIAQIEQRAKEMQEFDSMTVEQKKEKLLNDFTKSLADKVAGGKLTQEKADQMLADYKARLEQWDGTGNFPFLGMGGKNVRDGFKSRPGMEGKQGKMPQMKGNIDPAQLLERQKENLQQKVTDGKITQEEADKQIAQMEQRVREMQEFNSMTVEQKKEKLLNDFTTSLADKVAGGKLTQEKADQMLADYKAKLEQWDGSGNFPFIGMGSKGVKDGLKFRPGSEGKLGNREEMKGNIDPAQMLEKQKAAIQQRVSDGKLTQEEADKQIAQIEQRVKEMQEFNSMTVEQKKEKLLNNFTTSLTDRVAGGKLTQEKADQMLADYKAKLEQWDGTGNFPFIGMGKTDGKGFGGRPHKSIDEKAPQQQ